MALPTGGTKLQMDTINKLLKKQAPKRRGKVSAQETAGDATPNVQDAEQEKPKAVYVRWVSDGNSSRIGVPIEWFGTPVGKVFGEPRNDGHRGRMVEEIEG
jgi:Ino eighty subunit 2